MLDTSNDDAAMIVMLTRQMNRRMSLDQGMEDLDHDPLTEAQKRIPKFRSQDVKLGRRLGSGAFCSVYCVTKRTKSNSNNSGSSSASLLSASSSLHGSNGELDFSNANHSNSGGDITTTSLDMSADPSMPDSPLKGQGTDTEEGSMDFLPTNLTTTHLGDSTMATSSTLPASAPASPASDSPTNFIQINGRQRKMLRPRRQRRGSGTSLSIHDAGDTNNNNNTFQAGQYCFEIDRLQALKTLRKATKKSPEKLALAYQDLKNEVLILSSLSTQTSTYHANIIRFWGINDSFWTSPESAFMIQEKLVESLDSTLQRWSEDGGKALGSGGQFDISNNSGGSGGRGGGLTKGLSAVNVLSNVGSAVVGRPKKHLRAGAQAERIEQVALSIASALEFLHSQRILYRDLKPSNLGFDKNGIVKLFDFGLAVRLPPVTDVQSDDDTAARSPDQALRKARRKKTGRSGSKTGKTKLPGRVGTYRYMAPEVARSEYYSFPADVYSFGLVLFEICALEKPHAKAQSTEQLQRIAEQADVQPNLGPIQSKTLKVFLQSCWNSKPSARPDFSLVRSHLKREVENTKTT
mmetsp:Transcript_16650/g.36406  ORF Transcript_16650/g.36406 Transcript_16650/m.36406 type:complete len:577 (+) Transcript_16650:76-1806(+)